MPDAKLHDPLSRKPPSCGTAVPGRVPWPAIAGNRSPLNSSSTADCWRYAAPVPVARAPAIRTQAVDGSPYERFSITFTDETTSSSRPPRTDFGTQMP